MPQKVIPSASPDMRRLRAFAPEGSPLESCCRTARRNDLLFLKPSASPARLDRFGQDDKPIKPRRLRIAMFFWVVVAIVTAGVNIALLARCTAIDGSEQQYT